jgi:hypothetical protein
MDVNMTTEEIDLMDKVFVFLFEHRNKGFHYIYVAEKLKIPEKQYYFIYDQIVVFGVPLGLCTTDPEAEDMIADFSEYRCERFISKGGFRNYFERLLLNNPIATNPPIDEHKITRKNILVGIFVTVVGGFILYWILFHIMGEKP